jgi:hypothetical protein
MLNIVRLRRRRSAWHARCVSGVDARRAPTMLDNDQIPVQIGRSFADDEATPCENMRAFGYAPFTSPSPRGTQCAGLTSPSLRRPIPTRRAHAAE